MLKKLLKNQKKIASDNEMVRYNTLVSNSILCPYCSSDANLGSIIKQHMRSKKCLEMKRIFFEGQQTKAEPITEFDILNDINLKIQAVLPTRLNKYKTEQEKRDIEKQNIDNPNIFHFREQFKIGSNYTPR